LLRPWLYSSIEAAVDGVEAYILSRFPQHRSNFLQEISAVAWVIAWALAASGSIFHHKVIIVHSIVVFVVLFGLVLIL